MEPFGSLFIVFAVDLWVRAAFPLPPQMPARTTSFGAASSRMKSTLYPRNVCELMRTVRVSVNVLSSFFGVRFTIAAQVGRGCAWERKTCHFVRSEYPNGKTKTKTMRHSCHQFIFSSSFAFTLDGFARWKSFAYSRMRFAQTSRRTDYHENVIRPDQKPIKKKNYYYFH